MRESGVRKSLGEGMGIGGGRSLLDPAPGVCKVRDEGEILLSAIWDRMGDVKVNYQKKQGESHTAKAQGI